MAPKRRTEGYVIEPRDTKMDPISAPLVTTYSLKAILDSPNFQQTVILPSGRTVSYATCGSKTGTLVLYFYGLGGSCRQIASLHSQAVRLDIKLLCVDRPGTGYTDPFKSSSTTSSYPSSSSSSTASSSSSSFTSKKKRWSLRKESQFHHHLGIKSPSESNVSTKRPPTTSNVSSLNDYIILDTIMDSESEDNSGSSNNGYDNSYTENDNKKKRHTKFSSPISKDTFSLKRPKSFCPRTVNPRVHHTCLEAIEIVDLISPGAKFGLMGHSCGTYYIMHMVNTFPDRIEPGPISLLTPWIPFKECPDTTSKTFKFLKHVPRGLVWAVTSSINHLGSVIMSSSNAVTGALTNKDLNDTCVDEQGKDGAPPRDTSTDWMKSLSDPFIVQFSDAFDKIIIPALVQDMNRQHSNGYNSEIQMCVTDVGFDIAEVRMPPGVTVNAYFGYLDTVVPIAAAREMSKKCGWRINEFKHSGHGGPRMSMYALEDYVIGLQEYELSISEEEWFERRIDAQY